MSWLDGIIKRGLALRRREFGWSNPDNPTLDDTLKEAVRIGQLAKEGQNIHHLWTDAQWREISKAIEELESRVHERQLKVEPDASEKIH